MRANGCAGAPIARLAGEEALIPGVLAGTCVARPRRMDSEAFLTPPRSPRAPRLTLRALVGLLVVGCGGSPASTPDAGSGPALDCIGLFGCLDACPVETTPCDDDCLARATPLAVSQATALAVCADGAACGGDETCLTTNCPDEILACAGTPPMDGGAMPMADGGLPDAPPGAFPARIEGTTRDRTDAVGMITESVGTAAFVLDEDTGDLLGFPIDTYAFYRLESLTYTVTVSGAAGPCTFSANETVVTSSLSPSENQLVIERATGADGLHEYALSTAYTVDRTGALSEVCPPPGGTAYPEFHAEHYVSTGGSPGPRTDVSTFVGEYPRGPRVSSWDLHAL